MKKIFYLSITLLALSLTSCQGPGKSDEPIRYTFKGVHDFDVTETNDYIVRNNSTDYIIVLPEKMDSYLTTAKEELISIFQQGTGLTLDSVTEGEGTLSHQTNGKFISIGDTKMFQDSGLEINRSELGTQAAKIQTKDRTIYLNGGDNHGCIYAVYDLMEIFFNFDAYSYDCVNVDKHDEIKFSEIEVTDIPDIQIRSNSWGFIKENPNNIATRLRTPYDFSSYFLEVGDVEHGQNRGAIHNSLMIIPKAYWNSEHPKWFSDSGDQICYCAHGDADELNVLLDQSAKIIEDSLIAFTPDKYPLKNIVTFTMMDNNDICKCPACSAKKEIYGAQSGILIPFMNALRERIQTWMDKEENKDYRREDFNLLFFAYNGYVDAPAHKDETTGKYVLNHPDLQMRDDVGVYYAVSSGWQYQLNIYDEHNQVGVDNFHKWCDIAPYTYLWTYNANFGDYLFHINSTNFYCPDAYQLFANGHTKLLYNQGAWNAYNLTAFQMLAIYLDAKLSWNSNLDMNKLIDGWFEHMFRDGAEDMKKLYNEENLRSLMIMDKIGNLASSGIINTSVSNQDNFPIQTLYELLGYIDDARSKIAPYEIADPELYKTLKEHIDLEWVSPAYYLLNLYGKSYLPSDLYYEMANYFNDEILPLKPFTVSERAGTLSTWILSLLQ